MLQTFSGGATVPTRTLGDNTTNAASTAFVTNAIGAIVTSRTKLTGPLALYADFVNGNDSNACTSAGVGNACKTVQGAFNKLFQNYDTAGRTTTINFNNNDTTGLLITASWVGGGPITINGPGGSPPSIGLSLAGGAAIGINAPLPANLTLTNMAISGAVGVQVSAPGVVVLGNNLNFGTASAYHINVFFPGAAVNCSGSYTISGGAITHWRATIQGAITCQGQTITLTGTPAFTGPFAQASDLGLLYIPNMQFAGAATGSRYFVSGNSVIETAGNGANYLPGNAPGSVQSSPGYQ
jgi:hypothetical protein